MTGASAYGSGSEWENEDQLDLADDESLPWLEAGEDEEQTAGFDTSRLIRAKHGPNPPGPNPVAGLKDGLDT